MHSAKHKPCLLLFQNIIDIANVIILLTEVQDNGTN